MRPRRAGRTVLALFILLVAAVAVRETARLIVAAWLGLRLRAILLLPIGGLFAYANPESQEKANHGTGQFVLALAGPLANGCAGLTAAAAILGVSSKCPSLRPAAHHPDEPVAQPGLLQLLLGALHLFPAYPLDCGRIVRNAFARKHGAGPAGRAAAGLGQALALIAMLGGMLLHDSWLVLAGFFVMIGAQIEDQGVFFQSVVDTVRMREVMLTDFATLSPSDTLADALYRCVHSLQEDFPVVRGPQLVGIVSRQRIVDALRNDGNGYVQSVMSRAFQVARPEDTLGVTIRRLTAGHGLSLIPITESGRVVGIVSVQNLMNSMALLAEQRRIERHGTQELKARWWNTLNRRVPPSPSHLGTGESKSDAPLAPGLYLVATPIGNLGDITLRALDVLRSADRIACEDTRQTQKLLNHFQIAKKTVSYHEHNERERATELVQEIKRGSAIALVSDAGTPAVSDPGSWLVREAIAAGVPVFPIPGANAAISALIASGLPADDFHFLGFPPEKAGARRTFLEESCRIANNLTRASPRAR